MPRRHVDVYNIIPYCLQKVKQMFTIAEAIGFEPMKRVNVYGFPDRCLKPLGHASKRRKV